MTTATVVRSSMSSSSTSSTSSPDGGASGGPPPQPQQAGPVKTMPQTDPICDGAKQSPTTIAATVDPDLVQNGNGNGGNAATASASCDSTDANTTTTMLTAAPPVALQEALGVTPHGTCVRHSNCPVLSMQHNTIMSCRICFSEEKSVGIQQRRSFAAVVQQLQRMVPTMDDNSGSSKYQNSASNNLDLETAMVEQGEVVDDGAEVQRRGSHGHLHNLFAVNNPLAQQQSQQQLESIMKRLAQVQNWMLRQKEKEVLSLQLHIHRLEQRLHDAERMGMEQKQTIRALRRTIQQDLKIIKSMAVQKERAESQLMTSDNLSHMSTDPGTPIDMRSPATSVKTNVSSKTGDDSTPQLPSVMGSNSHDAASNNNSNKLAGRKQSSGGGGGGGGGGGSAMIVDDRMVSHHHGTTSPLQTPQQTPQTHNKPSARMALRTPSPNRGQHAPAPRTPSPTGMAQRPHQQQARRGVNPNKSKLASQLEQFKRVQARQQQLAAPKLADSASAIALGMVTTMASPARQLDADLPEPDMSDHRTPDCIEQTPQQEIYVNPPSQRNEYWNDDQVEQLASNPSRIFKSFRGGLLDIPKSPPPARHDNAKNRRKLHLQLGSEEKDALAIPMRSMHRNHSTQAAANATNLGDTEIPLDNLAATLQSLPVSRKINEENPQNLFASSTEYAGEDGAAAAAAANKNKANIIPPAPFTDSPTKQAQQQAQQRRASLSDHDTATVATADKEDSSSVATGVLTATYSIETAKTEPLASSSVPPPPVVKEGGAVLSPGDQTVYNEAPFTDGIAKTPDGTKKKESAAAALSGEKLPKTNDNDQPEGGKPEERFLFSVTNATCCDKYGDQGLYTGTILVLEAMPHGKGEMNYETGRVYSGDWVSGQWHGKGRLLNPNGDVYEGEFVFDARHGHGCYRWENGDVYVGNFHQDKRHGKGRFAFHNGNVYEGEFCDGMFEGFGKYSFEGGYYEGEWKQGRYDGNGELRYAKGGKYTGEFRNSVAHGFGLEVTPDGRKRRGVWENGQPVEYYERN